MSRDPVPEWFGKSEAEPPRQRGTAEARSSVGCAMPVALALVIAAAGAGAFVLMKRPSPKVATTAATVATVAPEVPQPVAIPVPPPPPVEPVVPVPVAPPEDSEGSGSAGSAGSEEPSAPVVDGTERLSAAKVRDVMDGARNRFRACYENALKYAPDAKGTVRLSLTIAPTGRVQTASTTQTGNLPPQVGTCIAAITRTLKFPESPESTTVTFPFSFTSG